MYVFIKINSKDSNSTAIQEELIKTTNTVLNTLNDYILDIDHTSRNLKNQVIKKYMNKINNKLIII